MKWLTNFKSFIFAFIFTTIGVISWGQTLPLQNPLEPYSSTNPYVIRSSDDWHTFVTDVNGGTDYSGKIVKLTASITASYESGSTTKCEMVGNDTYSFSGTFDGDNKTLTFNYSGDSEIAPFYDTYGATIQNLKVEGNITASAGYSAGLIYINYDETTINNVTVNVNITNGSNGSAGSNCAGFVVENKNYVNAQGLITFSNCVYNGKILAGTKSGGFCAYPSNGTATFSNCIFAPDDNSNIANGENFGTVAASIANCYFTKEDSSSEQGTFAYKTEPEGKIWKPFSVHGNCIYSSCCEYKY